MRIKFQSSHLQAGKSQNFIVKKIIRSYQLRLNFMKIIVGEGVLMERDLREMMGI